MQTGNMSIADTSGTKTEADDPFIQAGINV